MSEFHEHFTPEQQLFALAMFQRKIYQASGQTFQDLFVDIMTRADARFRPVKPQGREGDKGNDGFIPEEGRYFQVYAPEHPASKVTTAVTKAKQDFEKLKQHWEKVAEITDYRFVLNDKYKGTFPEVELVLAEIKREHSLAESKPFLAKDLESVFLTLSITDIHTVLGGVVPRQDTISDIDYCVFTEVLQHLVDTMGPVNKDGMLVVPDFDQKIKFNEIRSAASLLTVGSYQAGAVDVYFNRHGEFTRSDIRDRLAEGYQKAIEAARVDLPNNAAVGDTVYFDLLDLIAPNGTKVVQDAAVVLIAYFFEKCDVFEEPVQ